MEIRSWWLTDAVESQRRYPYTFYKPSAATIGKLGVGDQVKLIFEFDNPDPDGLSAERMWVTIKRIDGDRYHGELDNEPSQLTALRLGDPVAFEARHMIQTSLPETESDTIGKYRSRCFVTARVLYDGRPAACIYREEPGQEDDSGWRIMAGDEDQAYMDDEENIAYVSLGAVLNLDDAFLHLLDAPVDSVFERNAETGEFKALT